MTNYELKNTIDETIANLQTVKALLTGQRVLGSDPSDYPYHFHHGSWDCEDSPTGNCMYTTDFDACIFCGDPDERK